MRADGPAEVSPSLARSAIRTTSSGRGYDRLVDGIAVHTGLGDSIRCAGTSVVASSSRAESSMVVAYAVAGHTVLWCDPALADDLASLADPSRSAPLSAVAAWAEQRGWTRVSTNRMQLLPTATAEPQARPDDVSVRSLDRRRQGDADLIRTFAATLSEGDRDEADLTGDVDDLDENILAVIDAVGIAALASHGPFAFADGFGDIAVATRNDVRGRGFGRIAVAALCEEMVGAGLFPLYRCDEANVGSVRLSASLGFVPAVRVLACTRPGDSSDLDL